MPKPIHITISLESYQLLACEWDSFGTPRFNNLFFTDWIYDKTGGRVQATAFLQTTPKAYRTLVFDDPKKATEFVLKYA